MKPSPKFNHRPKHERVVKTEPAPEFTTGAVDNDFEDFGENLHCTVVPELVIHFGLDSPAIERTQAVAE